MLIKCMAAGLMMKGKTGSQQNSDDIARRQRCLAAHILTAMRSVRIRLTKQFGSGGIGSPSVRRPSM